VDPERIDEGALGEAAEAIRRGGLVAFPTETVYGLGADATNPGALAGIFEAKGRPRDNPLIVHVPGEEWLPRVASAVPPAARRLIDRFWPGPLTLVLRAARLPAEVTAGLPTVAVRCPAHPVALRLIELSGVPIAAPSANASGRPSPTSAEHVIEDLWGLVDVIVDSGETLYGLESTIIDVTRDPPVLLRPGAVPVENLEDALGSRVVVGDAARGLADSEVALSPGMKYRHYAPRKPLVLVESDDYSGEGYLEGVASVARSLAADGRRVIVMASDEHVGFYRAAGLETLALGPRSNPFAVARRLFAALRSLDGSPADAAVVEGFEERGLGLAIMNRLRKASGRAVVRVRGPRSRLYRAPAPRLRAAAGHDAPRGRDARGHRDGGPARRGDGGGGGCWGMGRVRPVAMTIAGSDSGGGAGIAADLKTFAAAGVHGTLAITSVTAQNTVAVTGIYDLPPEAVRRQILAVHEDMGIDAAKTGMLSSAPIVRAVAEVASQLGLTLVVDPVMVSKSGAALLREDAVEALARELVPRAKVVTPNAPEAERLTGIRVRDLAGARAAAEHIVEQLGAEAAVVKGGHLGGPESVDVLYHAGRHVELRSPRIESRTTHGTGCSFSAAIAAGLARGMGIEDSVDFAKRLVTDAIRYGLELGAGHGPVNPSSWVDVPAERFRALQDVRLALRVLVENEFFVSRVVPESSMNVAAALPAPYASGPGDVAAIAGGIGRFGRRLVARGEVEFGAAEQLAAALLGVSERFPEVRGAAIVASGEEVSRAMESLGFRALPSGGRGAALGRRDLGIAVSEALRGESAPPDAVVDGGGPGLEPLTIVFGRSAVEAASKVAAIGKAIAGAGTPSADRGRGTSGSGGHPSGAPGLFPRTSNV
jgi:hydroxymethylpyrimidine/phosphomethylpyrimidine kinase